ncbi:uncharacterized protein LOC123481952 isoform X1 [Coregonus clupeaformis]|uniref:uncharacterized protein LOC123481952 isoform X1 n=1 Tax=Coregonus clupeaformis TaxID=59861 RepID=UPI001E1C972A|nr:uncharacterized protein LOC123481952 isoform X1 [Coregonus clupeaformis]
MGRNMGEQSCWVGFLHYVKEMWYRFKNAQTAAVPANEKRVIAINRYITSLYCNSLLPRFTSISSCRSTICVYWQRFFSISLAGLFTELFCLTIYLGYYFGLVLALFWLCSGHVPNCYFACVLLTKSKGHVHDNMSIKTSVSMRHQHTLHVSLGRQHQHALHLSLCHQHQHALHLSLCHQHQHALHLSLCHSINTPCISACATSINTPCISACATSINTPCISACAASINTPWISTLTSTAQI